MYSTLMIVVVVVALTLAAAGAVTAAPNRVPSSAVLGGLLVGACALEVLVLAQSLIAGVRLAAGERVGEQATFIGYLIGVAFVVPVAASWSLAERTRWSGLVVALGALTVAVMTLRLNAIWSSAHA